MRRIFILLEARRHADSVGRQILQSEHGLGMDDAVSQPWTQLNSAQQKKLLHSLHGHQFLARGKKSRAMAEGAVSMPLQPRDLRIIDPSFSSAESPHLLVRRHCMILNMAPIRAMVLSNRLLLFPSGGLDPNVTAVESHIVSGGGQPSDMPFELRALEAILVIVVGDLQAAVAKETKRVAHTSKRLTLRDTSRAVLGTMRDSARVVGSLQARTQASQKTLSAVLDNHKALQALASLTVRSQVAEGAATYKRGGGKAGEEGGQAAAGGGSTAKVQRRPSLTTASHSPQLRPSLSTRRLVEPPAPPPPLRVAEDSAGGGTPVDAASDTTCDWADSSPVGRKSESKDGTESLDAAGGAATAPPDLGGDEAGTENPHLTAPSPAQPSTTTPHTPAVFLGVKGMSGNAGGGSAWRLDVGKDRRQAAEEVVLVPAGMSAHDQEEYFTSVIELLLEAYVAELDAVSRELDGLSQELDSNEKQVSHLLATTRNRLLLVDIVISLTSLVLGVWASVFGAFGMNLSSGLETQPSLFWDVLWGSLGGGVALLLVLFAAFKYWVLVATE